MYHRLYIYMLSLVFPPLAVWLIKGVGDPQTVLNALLFLVAIIPSYIHGFYVIGKHFHDEDNRQSRKRRERSNRDRIHSSRGSRRSRSRNRSRNHSITTSTSSTYSGSNARLFPERRWRGTPLHQRQPAWQREQEIWYGEVEEREEDDVHDTVDNSWHGQPLNTSKYITWTPSSDDVPPPCPNAPRRDRYSFD